MSPRYDVAIVGAGMVGLALTAMLVRQVPALGIIVVDSGPSPTFDEEADIGLRVSAVSPGSAALLERSGAWPAIRELRACAYQRMRVWDAGGRHDAPGALVFSADELGLEALGHITENALIRQRLFETVRTADVDWRFGRRVSALRVGERSARLDLDDDASLSCALVVGADGARSAIRNMAGLAARSWRYPQDALVTHVRPERAHEATAWQRFLPTGPIALLPLADGRCSVVWSAETNACRELLTLDDSTLGRRLTAATDGVLGPLRIAGPKASFPLWASYAPNYTTPRVALAGDAAHAIHPLAGQGVNLGFSDAAELAASIAGAHEKGADPGDMPALRRYERARKGENMQTLIFLDGLQRLFSVDSRVAGGLRRAGMGVFDRIGPLKRMAVKQATGIGKLAG